MSADKGAILNMKYNLPDRILREIVSFAKEHSITKIILFGSRARGTNTERSDIDIAVYGGDFDEFYWEYCHGNIPKRKVKGWEKDTYYPDLDEIYKIAALLNLNPNEMLEARDTKQKSTVREVNPSARRMGERIFKLTKPTIRFILNLIPIIAAIMLAVSYKLLDAGWNKKPELPKGMIEYYVGERNTDTTTNNNVNTNISDSTENSNLTVNSEKDNDNSDKNNDENIN